MISFLSALFSFAGTVVYAVAVKFFGDVITDKIADFLVVKLLRRKHNPKAKRTFLFSEDCGNKGLKPDNRHLQWSLAFGSYFTGLLEREHNYVHLKDQIVAPPVEGNEGLDPLQRIYHQIALAPEKKVILIAAEGGMGKSTLAAKIIRCLLASGQITWLLGDSAKTQVIHLKSGEITETQPEFYDVKTFFEKLLVDQLRENYDRERTSNWIAVQQILNAVADRRTILVIDNLETIHSKELSSFIKEIKPLATSTTKILITSRVTPSDDVLNDVYVVTLKSITTTETASEFIRWHILNYSSQISNLSKLEPIFEDRKKVEMLLNRTGGNPLVMQLVMSGIALSDVDYLKNLPENILPSTLLDYLYLKHWNEILEMGDKGKDAIRLLKFVDGELYEGKKITSKKIIEWMGSSCIRTPFTQCVSILQDRFLLIDNNNKSKGSYAIVPSLSSFLKTKTVD